MTEGHDIDVERKALEQNATAAYDRAKEELYRGPHESFVAKRRELAAELKGKGDKVSAARLARLARPSLSAWAVNQLWWHSRSAFDELFESAERVRVGKEPAGGAHRQAVSKLTARAKQVLESDEHGGNEATLRRITMTLSALAATGGWDPEQPGMLTQDLDPPGFEAFAMIAAGASKPHPEARRPSSGNEATAENAKEKRASAEATAREEAEAKQARERERAAAAAEQKRLTEQRIKHAAEKTALESVLRAAKTALTNCEHDRDRAAKALKIAEHEVERARARVAAAETELSEHSNRS